MTLTSLILFLCLLAALGWLAYRFQRGATARAQMRASLLAEADGLLTIREREVLDSGYVKLAGDYQGASLRLHPIVDSLAMRKLPVLWLSITLIRPMPVKSRFDLMMRASGAEIFSGFHALPIQIATPAGFPEAAQIRADGMEGLPEESLIARHLRPYHDDMAKELLITPDGIRMVWLVAQAERSRYLFFRDAEFENPPIPRQSLMVMFEAITALADDLEKGSTR